MRKRELSLLKIGSGKKSKVNGAMGSLDENEGLPEGGFTSSVVRASEDEHGRGRLDHDAKEFPQKHKLTFSSASEV